MRRYPLFTLGSTLARQSRENAYQEVNSLDKSNEVQCQSLDKAEKMKVLYSMNDEANEELPIRSK